MLQPKRSKHRKQQKGRIREIAKRGASIAFGSFALKSLDPIWLTNRQLESARQAMTRAMKREKKKEPLSILPYQKIGLTNQTTK